MTVSIKTRFKYKCKKINVNSFLIMIFATSLALCSFVLAQSHAIGAIRNQEVPIKLKPIAGSRYEFQKPLKQVEAIYAAETTGKTIGARLKFTASKPTLNLNEYQGISKIS